MNIKKIAGHLKGEETKETKELFAEVEKKLVEAGYEAPFTFNKIASDEEWLTRQHDLNTLDDLGPELYNDVRKFLYTSDISYLSTLATMKLQGKTDDVLELIGIGVDDFIGSRPEAEVRSVNRSALVHYVYKALDEAPADELQVFDEMNRKDEAREMKNSREPF